MRVSGRPGCRSEELVTPLWSGTAQQTLTQIGIGGDIDGRPGHGKRAIDDGVIGGCRDAVRRKLRLMIHRW